MNNKMDIIISLVGLNPIPNYISILNYCKEDSKIFLIHSDKNEMISSEEVAKNIEKVTLERFENIEITSFKSSKSDFKSIVKIICDVKEAIKKIITSTKQEKFEILLDITGSTKPNSAFAYSILNSFFEKEKDKVRFYKCYVSGEEEKIYQRGYEDCEYKLEDLAEDTKVTKEELLALHGYEKDKKANVNLEKFDKIILKDFTLIFYVKSKKTSFKELKEEIIIYLDIIEKLGGSLSKIFFEAKSFRDTSKKSIEDEEGGQKDFIDRLENGINRIYGDRIILKSSSDGSGGYCSCEEIEELIKGDE